MIEVCQRFGDWRTVSIIRVVSETLVYLNHPDAAVSRENCTEFCRRDSCKAGLFVRGEVGLRAVSLKVTRTESVHLHRPLLYALPFLIERLLLEFRKAFCCRSIALLLSLPDRPEPLVDIPPPPPVGPTVPFLPRENCLLV